MFQKAGSLRVGETVGRVDAGDKAEQRETFEALRRSLDEDRPEGYKLFS